MAVHPIAAEIFQPRIKMIKIKIVFGKKKNRIENRKVVSKLLFLL